MLYNYYDQYQINILDLLPLLLLGSLYQEPGDGRTRKKKQFQSIVINILQVGLDAEEITTFASHIK